MEALIVPAKQNAPLDPNTQGEFARQWYLFFQTLREYAATGAGICAYGTAQDRQHADPQNRPDGALWIETDSNAIYQWRAAGPTPDWLLLKGAGMFQLEVLM